MPSFTFHAYVSSMEASSAMAETTPVDMCDNRSLLSEAMFAFLLHAHVDNLSYCFFLVSVPSAEAEIETGSDVSSSLAMVQIFRRSQLIRMQRPCNSTCNSTCNSSCNSSCNSRNITTSLAKLKAFRQRDSPNAKAMLCSISQLLQIYGD